MGMLLACVLCTVCVSGIWEGRKASDPLELQIQTIVCRCVGAETLTQVLWAISPAPFGCFQNGRVWESFLIIFLIRGCVLNQFGDLSVLQNMTLVFCDFSTWWPTHLLHAVLLRRSEISVLRVGIAGKRCMPLWVLPKGKPDASCSFCPFSVLLSWSWSLFPTMSLGR